jgi:dihydroneopterin aldolase
MRNDKIILEGMTFYGYHGATMEEKQLGQRFIVDVELETSLARSGQSDQLSDTIDYGAVFQCVHQIVTGPSKNLLEALAEEIANTILGTFPAQGVRIRVKKPAVPIKNSILTYAAVEIFRSRGEQ